MLVKLKQHICELTPLNYIYSNIGHSCALHSYFVLTRFLYHIISKSIKNFEQKLYQRCLIRPKRLYITDAQLQQGALFLTSFTDFYTSL